MELLLLLFLLSSQKEEKDVRKALLSALAFYRENRELLLSLRDMPAARHEVPPRKEAPRQDEPHEKSRPQADGNPDILQQFLNGL